MTTARGPRPADAESAARPAPPRVAASTRHPQAALPEEVRGAFEYMPATIAGNLAGVAVVTLLFHADAPPWLLLPWLLAFALMLTTRGWLAVRFRRASPAGVDDWRRWQRAWNAGTLASGLMWGATAWLFFDLGDGNQRIGLVVTVYTFCIAAVPVLATQPRVYLAFAALCFVPMVARLLLDGTHHSLELASMLVLIFTLTSALARHFRNALRRAIDLTVQADALLAELRAEREAADDARRAAESEREAADRARAAAEAARREAEAASRAKTQFLAAASHDLRQPLHAMGLFAEALRERRHDADTLHLVNSINASVHALEELFSELLDLTRLDAGGVTPSPRSFAIGDVFRRLAIHQRPEAFEKGLALRLRGHGRVVHADPVLVERILRNLVANAIRYTDDGGVLVGARPRGSRVVLQVWDSGRGIAPSEQDRVFDEFYQVTGAPGPAAHEKRGLGLGLAIVKRIAALMDAPLGLRSRPGQGSVFELSLPAGRLPSPTAQGVAARPADAPPLGGRTVLVVEDDAAVRGGLQVLLQGWGAAVVALPSAAALDDWLAARPPTPDLAIVDYRLEPGRDGLQALAACRARFGAGLPAVVVTGSLLANLDVRAEADDFDLLVKPVVPAKLRAVLSFKLAGRRA